MTLDAQPPTTGIAVLRSAGGITVINNWVPPACLNCPGPAHSLSDCPFALRDHPLCESCGRPRHIIGSRAELDCSRTPPRRRWCSICRSGSHWYRACRHSPYNGQPAENSDDDSDPGRDTRADAEERWAWVFDLKDEIWP